MKKQHVLALTCLVLSVGLHAEANKVAVTADTAEKLGTTKTEVLSQMKPGGRYEFISSSNKSSVDRLFDEMMTILTKYGSVGAMPDKARLELFNDQERINGLLLGSDSERKVCTREAPTGSHRPITTCRTYGQIETERRESERFMNSSKSRYDLNTGG